MTAWALILALFSAQELVVAGLSCPSIAVGRWTGAAVDRWSNGVSGFPDGVTAHAGGRCPTLLEAESWLCGGMPQAR